jgi:hypothetical protein
MPRLRCVSSPKNDDRSAADRARRTTRMFGCATYATMRACLTADGPPPETPVSTTAASFGAPSGAGARGRQPHAAGGRCESEALADRGKQILLQARGL